MEPAPTRRPQPLECCAERCQRSPINEDRTRPPRWGAGAILVRLGEAAGLWGLGQNDRKHATCMPSGFESRLSLPSRRATHPADATIGHWGRVCTVKLAILLVQMLARVCKTDEFADSSTSLQTQLCLQTRHTRVTQVCRHVVCVCKYVPIRRVCR